MIPGTLVYVDGLSMWAAAGSTLLRSDDGGGRWYADGELPVSRSVRLTMSCRLARRLARAGVHHMYRGQNTVVVANRSIFVRSKADASFRKVADIHGSRPMAIAAGQGIVCYGEYRANAGRTDVSVWGTEDEGETWHPLKRISRVRHIHGVYYDDCSGLFWMTTGDEDDESAIWASDDKFRSIGKIHARGQSSRAVDLLFTRDYVYFGSDSPLVRNHIYRLEKSSGRVETLAEVGSSVFYGCKLGSHLFFSTAAEPSDVNRHDRAEVWHSQDGDRWELIRHHKKDVWSFHWFQYGQVRFPGGPGDGTHLYFTPFATEGDQVTVTIPITSLGSSGSAGTMS